MSPTAHDPSAPRVVLASQSPRRSEILRAAGFDFTVRPAAVDETALEGTLGFKVPESSALLSEQLNALAARLNELSPRVRDAILWHHRDGYTCDEVAEKLSAATHRVKKYLVKGLAHCRASPSIEAA